MKTSQETAQSIMDEFYSQSITVDGQKNKKLKTIYDIISEAIEDTRKDAYLQGYQDGIKSKGHSY
jgi:hypothetical protein